MSSRRAHGRFATTNANDQRLLTAPAVKWKRAWVRPTGLAPESSYKTCKWVRVPKDEQEVDETFSQAGDGDEEDEAMEEDQADEDGDDKPDTPIGDTTQATPSAGTPLDTPLLETPVGELQAAPLSANPNAPALSSSLAGPPLTAASGTTSETGTPAAAAVAEASPAEVVGETAIPSNAIEVTNVAPGHTEEGQRDLGGKDPVVEVHAPEAGAAATSAGDDVEMAEGGGDVPAGETESVPIKEDEGLVHGEMEPPVPELAVTEGDHPPTEVEEKKE